MLQPNVPENTEQRVDNIIIDGVDYEVILHRPENEFVVVRLRWTVRSGHHKQTIGKPVPVDRPLDEYNNMAYHFMVINALEEEEEWSRVTQRFRR